MPSRYMTLSTAERRLVVMDAMALRGDVVVGEYFLACGASNKKQLADATASSNTAPMPIRQWYHSPMGAATIRPSSPQMTVAAINVPAERPADNGWPSSFRSTIANAGTPPKSTPSNTRNTKIASNVGDSVAPIPNTHAAMIEIVMAGFRPRRSPTKDHGITAKASPMVDAETNKAVWSAVVCRSTAISGSNPCGEYNWAKVATPAKNSPAMRRRKPAVFGACPNHTCPVCGSGITG